MKIDSHQHFWQYDPPQYGWMDENTAVLRRNFEPADLQKELQTKAIDGSVAVQARQSLVETQWLLELAGQNSFIKGIVGWVDLRDPKIENYLEEYAAQSKFKGVRHVLQDEPDDDFMLQQSFLNGIGRLRKYNLTYDILIFPRHITYACKMVRQFPRQKFVLDHIAKPTIRNAAIEPWKTDMRKLAKLPNVWCKVSGMVTEASWKTWKKQDFTPYLESVLEMFGPRRLMFGSDWPICTLAATYGDVVDIIMDFISKLSPAEQANTMGLNAIEFYSLTTD